MGVGKDTQCCISIAERPGNFGSTVFGAGFKALGLDFIYKPFKVAAEDLDVAIKAVRAFGIRGCGVSMPHKISVIKYLDKIDPIARRIGAVNTIVNTSGVLKGYNTDVEGVQKALSQYYNTARKEVLIIGAGGIARAAVWAVKKSGASRIFITNRGEKNGAKLAKEFSLSFIPFEQRNFFKTNLLINATPVGMVPNDRELIVNEHSLRNFDAVMDVVLYPQPTRLIRSAMKLGKIVIPGSAAAFYQAAAQFRLYTGQNPPIVVLLRSIKNFLGTQ